MEMGQDNGIRLNFSGLRRLFPPPWWKQGILLG